MFTLGFILSYLCNLGKYCGYDRGPSWERNFRSVITFLPSTSFAAGMAQSIPTLYAAITPNHNMIKYNGKWHLLGHALSTSLDLKMLSRKLCCRNSCMPCFHDSKTQQSNTSTPRCGLSRGYQKKAISLSLLQLTISITTWAANCHPL